MTRAGRLYEGDEPTLKRGVGAAMPDVMTPRVLLAPGRLAGSALLGGQSDERLVDLVRAGSDRAFEAIVERYRGPLLRYCRGILLDERAEDALQQTFLNAVTALRRGDEPVALRPWLYRIAHNAALMILRQRGWTYAELDEEMAAAGSPAATAETRADLQQLLSSLRALPARQRDAIVLREIDGRSHDEIGAALGLNDVAVRQLLHRARTKLRDGATAIVPFWLLRHLLSPDRGGAGSSPNGPDAARLTELCARAGRGLGSLKLGAAAGATAMIAGAALYLPLSGSGETSGDVGTDKGRTPHAASVAAGKHRAAVALAQRRERSDGRRRNTGAPAPRASDQPHGLRGGGADPDEPGSRGDTPGGGDGGPGAGGSGDTGPRPGTSNGDDSTGPGGTGDPDPDSPGSDDRDPACEGETAPGTYDGVVVAEGERCSLRSARVHGNVIALPGARVTADGATIEGNVEGRERSELVIDSSEIHGGVTTVAGSASITDSTVDGDVIGDQPESLRIVDDSSGSRASSVGGNISATGVRGTLLICGTNLPAGNIDALIAAPDSLQLIGDSLSCSGLGGGNTLQGGNIKVEEGSPRRLAVHDNQVAADLQVSNILGAGEKTVRGNQVSANLDCHENDAPFQGGPNTALTAFGQCY